jgi:hypothetical protein
VNLNNLLFPNTNDIVFILILLILVEMTLANYVACKELQDFLAARLAKPNHNVKYKVLVIIRHICRSGRVEFKREMGRHIDVIKGCLQFTGPPDPLRGESIYLRVREAAREAIDAIFDSQMPETTSAVKASNRIMGMGGGEAPPEKHAPERPSGYLDAMSKALSSASTAAYKAAASAYTGQSTQSQGKEATAYGGYKGAEGSFAPPQLGGSGIGIAPPGTMPSSYSTSSGNSTSFDPNKGAIQGFGNPNFKDPRTEKSMMERLSHTASAFISGGEPSKTTLNPNIRSDGVAQPSPQTGQLPAYLASNRELPKGMGSPGTNVWGQPNQVKPYDGNSDGTQPPSQGGPRVVPELPQSTGGLGRAGVAVVDGQYESTIVSKLCDSGGMKAEPRADLLKPFLQKAQTLSSDTVGAGLLDALNNDSWQSRVKALLVIAALAQQSGCETHVGWWQANLDSISALETDSKASVRTQAIKTVAAVKAAIGTSPQSAISVVDSGAGGANLLDFDVGESETVPTPTLVVPTSSAPSANGGALFAGMGLASKKQSALSTSNTSTAASDLLGMLGSSTPDVPMNAPPPVPTVAPSSNLDILGLQVPLSYPGQTPLPMHSSSGFSFLDNTSSTDVVNTNTNVVSTMSDSTDLLGDMNSMSMNSNSVVTSVVPGGVEMAGSNSGFSFMGSSPASTSAPVLVPGSSMTNMMPTTMDSTKAPVAAPAPARLNNKPKDAFSFIDGKI